MSFEARRLDLLAQFQAHKVDLTADATRRAPKPLLDSAASFLRSVPANAALCDTLETTAKFYDTGDVHAQPPTPPAPLDMTTVDAAILALETITPPAVEPSQAEPGAEADKT